MMKLQRPDPPAILAQIWEAWGQQYEMKRLQNSKYEFKWRKKIYLLLIDLLLKMTKEHCSFCDSFPLHSQIRETVEHFRPKKDYPRLVYQWENIIACCDRCQNAKGDKFEEPLLKPDEMEYEFKRYFFFEEATGHLIPNPSASPEDQGRAITTIQLYKLNEFKRPEARLWALEIARQCPTLPIDKHPYRFMFL